MQSDDEFDLEESAIQSNFSFALSDQQQASISILRSSHSDMSKRVKFVEASIVPGALEVSRRIPRRITKEEREETTLREEKEEEEFDDRCAIERYAVEHLSSIVLGGIVTEEHATFIDDVYRYRAPNLADGLVTTLQQVEADEEHTRRVLLNAQRLIFVGVLSPSYVVQPLEELHRAALMQQERRARDLNGVMWSCDRVEEQRRGHVVDLEVRLRSLVEQREVGRRAAVARQTAAVEEVRKALKPWDPPSPSSSASTTDAELRAILSHPAPSTHTNAPSRRSLSPSECGGSQEPLDVIAGGFDSTEEGALVEAEEEEMRTQVYDVLFRGVDTATIWGERVVPHVSDRWLDLAEVYLQLPRSRLAGREGLLRRALETMALAEGIQLTATVEQALLEAARAPLAATITIMPTEGVAPDTSSSPPSSTSSLNLSSNTEDAVTQNISPPILGLTPAQEAEIVNGECRRRGEVVDVEARHYIVFSRDFRLGANEAREAADAREAKERLLEAAAEIESGATETNLSFEGATTSMQFEETLSRRAPTAQPQVLSLEEMTELRLIVKGNLVGVFDNASWIPLTVLLDGVWAMHSAGRELLKAPTPPTSATSAFAHMLQVLSVMLSQKVSILADNWARRAPTADLNKEGIALPIGEVVMAVLMSLPTAGDHRTPEGVDKIATCLAQGLADARRMHIEFPMALNSFTLLDVGRCRLVSPQLIRSVLGSIFADAPTGHTLPLVPLCDFVRSMENAKNNLPAAAVSQCIERSLINNLLVANLQQGGMAQQWRAHIASLRRTVSSSASALHGALLHSYSTAAGAAGNPLKRWLSTQRADSPDAAATLISVGALEHALYTIFEDRVRTALSDNSPLLGRFESFRKKPQVTASMATPLLGDVLFTQSWHSFLLDLSGAGDLLYSDATCDVGWVAVPRGTLVAMSEHKLPHFFSMTAPFTVTSVVVSLREFLFAVSSLVDAFTTSIIGTRNRRGRSYMGCQQQQSEGSTKPVPSPPSRGFTRMMSLLDTGRVSEYPSSPRQ